MALPQPALLLILVLALAVVAIGSHQPHAAGGQVASREGSRVGGC